MVHCFGNSVPPCGMSAIQRLWDKGGRQVPISRLSQRRPHRQHASGPSWGRGTSPSVGVRPAVRSDIAQSQSVDDDEGRKSLDWLRLGLQWAARMSQHVAFSRCATLQGGFKVVKTASRARRGKASVTQPPYLRWSRYVHRGKGGPYGKNRRGVRHTRIQ